MTEFPRQPMALSCRRRPPTAFVMVVAACAAIAAATTACRSPGTGASGATPADPAAVGTALDETPRPAPDALRPRAGAFVQAMAKGDAQAVLAMSRGSLVVAVAVSAGPDAHGWLHRQGRPTLLDSEREIRWWVDVLSRWYEGSAMPWFPRALDLLAYPPEIARPLEAFLEPRGALSALKVVEVDAPYPGGVMVFAVVLDPEGTSSRSSATSARRCL